MMEFFRIEGVTYNMVTLEQCAAALKQARIGAERAAHFVANWRQLVLVLRRGELRPGHLKAVKPAS
jgi:hypothetical protein